MVRVITIHNFLGQNVAQIEEPSATCTATVSGREMLLLALSTHCIEVWELMNSDIKLYTVFPTVDTVNQMIHSLRGDYVATLESKYPRDSGSDSHTNRVHANTFVRIYVNWAVMKDQSQPMRARIAGRVTPSLDRPLNSLEMIELPLSIQPTLIACCQSTGNLLVASGSTAILHEFKVEIQQLSKMKFIDFEARPWSLGFTFCPTYMDIVEDFICIMDKSNLCVFRLANSMYEDIDQLSSLTSTNSNNSSTLEKTSVSTDSSLVENSIRNDVDVIMISEMASPKCKDRTTECGIEHIGEENNVQTLVNHLKLKSKRHRGPKTSLWCKLESGDISKTRKNLGKKTYIDWDHLIYNEKEELQRLITEEIIDVNSQPITMNLPSISLERAGPGHTLSPFILNSPDVSIMIKTNSPDLGWSENYIIKDLLRLKITMSKSNNRKLDDNSEYFRCLVLKPLYMRRECNSGCVKKSIVRSDKYKHLHGVSCFVCTVQEGYLYHFSATNANQSDATCLTTYPFTAPVNHIALEHSALHALTEAGLESYTLRLSHHVAKTWNIERHTSKNIHVCPGISEPVCLIGLRPFLGVEKLLHTKSYLIILAKAESSWTMYSLILPKLENVYYDILNAARTHKSSSPTTYRHLLGEAHALIRLAKDVVIYSCPDNNERENDLTIRSSIKLKNLYNQSCALLADYYIRSEAENDWDLCTPYYKMSGLKPAEVLARKSSQDAPGLVTFLTDTLLTMRSGSEADALFQGYNIVEMICKLRKRDLLKLIFGSSVLREYSTEKLINILLSYQMDDPTKLALALLYIQAEKQEQAENVLKSVSENCIKKIIVEHWDLLFDVTAMKKRSPITPTFSDFAGTLMRQKITTFADVLISIIEEDGVLSLHQVIQVFLEYLPSRVGRDGHNAATTLQVFIEKYLQDYFDTNSNSVLEPALNKINKDLIRTDFALVEAFKLLIRSYLGKLTQSKLYNKNGEKEKEKEIEEKCFVFSKCRPRYLDRMPPCSKEYQKILYADDVKDLENINEPNSESYSNRILPPELYKLQSILSYEFLPSECLHEVKQFLDSQENIDGDLSLETLCTHNTEEATLLLMDTCPQAVLQYAKDKYTKDAEWKYLIELTRNRIATSTARRELHCLYSQMIKEIFNYLPHTLPLPSLHCILAKDDTILLQKCTEMSDQLKHADHVKSLVMETGQQLLSTWKL